MPQDISQLIPQAPDPNAMAQTAPPAAAAPVGPELASPQQVQELQDLLSKVKNAQSSLVTQKLIKRNETNMMQKQLMNSLFGLMQTAGVDPANPESVKAFLTKLSQQSPDLVEIFQQAFSDLSGGPLGGSTPPAPQSNPEGGSLMDNFRSLPGMMPPQVAPPDPSMAQAQ